MTCNEESNQVNDRESENRRDTAQVSDDNARVNGDNVLEKIENWAKDEGSLHLKLYG